jgi:uncharacterized small protein (DUF1192 family)
MAVSESDRHQLFEAAKAVFGESSAEIFMNLNPNLEWDRLVTNDDLARLDVATRADIAALRAEIAALEARLQNRFTTVLLASQGVLLMALTLIIALAVK